MKLTQDIFDKIETLLPILEAYMKKTSGVRFSSIEQRQTLIDLTQSVLNIPAPNVACDSCYINLIELLLEFYQKEYPKFLEANQSKPNKEPRRKKK